MPNSIKKKEYRVSALMSGLGPMFVTTKHEAWAKWWHGVGDRA